jgi:hypothetical protein
MTTAHVTSARTIFTLVRAEVVLVSYSFVLGSRVSGQAQGQPPQLTHSYTGMRFRFPAIEARDSHHDAGITNTG